MYLCSYSMSSSVLCNQLPRTRVIWSLVPRQMGLLFPASSSHLSKTVTRLRHRQKETSASNMSLANKAVPRVLSQHCFDCNRITDSVWQQKFLIKSPEEPADRPLMSLIFTVGESYRLRNQKEVGQQHASTHVTRITFYDLHWRTGGKIPLGPRGIALCPFACAVSELYL